MGRKITKIESAAQMPTRQRVAAYARVSCGKDGMLHSLAAQVSFYSNLIQSKPEWEYAGVYADEAETGTKSSRPEFQRLIADCRARAAVRRISLRTKSNPVSSRRSTA